MDANGLKFWMLSQQNDWLPPWRALSAYMAGQSVMDPYGFIQTLQVAGKSDAAAPAWNTNIGKTTIDGSITWINSGPGTWQAKTAYAVGQYILDSNNNLQLVSSGGTSGATQPAWPQTMNQPTADGTVTWICCGPAQTGLFYCSKNNRLQLRSMRTGGPFTEDFNTATTMVETALMALDQFGTYARWDPSSGHVVAGGAGPTDAPPPDEVPIYAPPILNVTDLVLGYDGVLYIAVNGSLVMVDRRNRWPNFTLAVPDFNFWRLAALPEGGVLALDRNKPQLGTVSGQPLQTGPVDVPNPGILRSCQPNPNPPQIVSRIALPASEWFVALAPLDPTQQPAQFMLLSWASNSASNQTAYLRIFSEGSASGTPLQLAGVRFPYSIAGLGNQKLAALASNLNEALIYDLSNAGETLVPAGETYILAANNAGPFVHGFDLPPNYANVPGANPLMLPLLPLSLNSFASSGATLPSGPSIIDSGVSQTMWHRMFFEAVLPPRCGGVIWLSASDSLSDLYRPLFVWLNCGKNSWQGQNKYPVKQYIIDPSANVQVVQTAGVSGQSAPTWAKGMGQATNDGTVIWKNLGSLRWQASTNFLAGQAILDSSGNIQVAQISGFSGSAQPTWASTLNATTLDGSVSWYPHIFGDASTTSIPASILPQAPEAVWQSISTEVAFGPTLLDEDPIENRQGLFMVLVQRANKVVRNLSGRFLGVRIQLNGDGRNTPEIAGMRIYASRFSYVQHYLPAIYHEEKFPPDAEQDGTSSRRDFLERFVDLFEAQFTRIEDRVANAYLLTRPESTPDGSIGWLGSWIGIPPNSYPPDRSRARLQAAPSLYQWRGTTQGLTQALDVATNGMCSNGAIIVIEDFRLRHIFATILGADLSIQNDPLLPGYSGSSNSIVGDTLFLGDPGVQAELQALYETDLNIAGSTQAVQSFYDQLAHRMTVFIHNQVENVNLNLVQRIVEAEKPAHVQAFVRVASQPFMIGLASLLGVNSYLAPEPPRNSATVDVSEIGRYDVVMHMPSLDPRLDNGEAYQEYDKPIARIQGPTVAKAGSSVVLDGSASTSPSGTNISSYTWTLVQPQG